MTKTGLILLFIFQLSFCQEPAPYFRIGLDSLKGSTEASLEQYEFVTGLFRQQIDSSAFVFSPARTQNQLITSNDHDLLLYISHRLADPPQKGNIISISVKDKKTQQCMGVFIRLGRSLDSGEEIRLDHLRFAPGNYYLDLCGRDVKTKPCSIDLREAMRHRHKMNAINKLILTLKCS